jgi:hydroxymethylpyrimidine pyrophosphatase-like HAD family hydrolase
LIIFDLDGTLCDITHRLHHIKGAKKDWDAFNSACTEDLARTAERAILLAMYDAGYKIVICTGRSENYRIKTENWLDNNGIKFHDLRMRKAGDYRSDYIVKAEMVSDQELEEVLFIVEDRERVVQMWRERGATCLQNVEGTY